MGVADDRSGCPGWPGSERSRNPGAPSFEGARFCDDVFTRAPHAENRTRRISNVTRSHQARGACAAAISTHREVAREIGIQSRDYPSVTRKGRTVSGRPKATHPREKDTSPACIDAFPRRASLPCVSLPGAFGLHDRRIPRLRRSLKLQTRCAKRKKSAADQKAVADAAFFLGQSFCEADQAWTRRTPKQAPEGPAAIAAGRQLMHAVDDKSRISPRGPALDRTSRRVTR